MSDETAPKLSPVEGHKTESRYLRGTLLEELADESRDSLSDANKSLIKFHGSYEQEDRDARKARSKASQSERVSWQSAAARARAATTAGSARSIPWNQSEASRPLAVANAASPSRPRWTRW